MSFFLLEIAFQGCLSISVESVTCGPLRTKRSFWGQVIYNILICQMKFPLGHVDKAPPG